MARDESKMYTGFLFGASDKPTEGTVEISHNIQGTLRKEHGRWYTVNRCLECDYPVIDGKCKSNCPKNVG